MKGSFVVGVVTAGRGVRETGAGFAGRDEFCAVTIAADESTRNAIRCIKACRELCMSHLRAWGARFQRRPNLRRLTYVPLRSARRARSIPAVFRLLLGQ